MATRSAIAIKHGDVIKGIYAHWDGYLSCNGRILFDHYQNSVKVNKLISLGDVSSLGAEIGEEHDFNKTEPNKDYCTFYGRDRGETGTEWKTFNTVDEFVDYYDGCGSEYFYLYDNGTWLVRSYETCDFEPLSTELIMEALTQ